MKSPLALLGFAVIFALPLKAQTTTTTVVNGNAENCVVRELFSPIYPPLARAANIAGAVELVVTINPDGRAQAAAVVSGHAILKQAAIESATKSSFKCRDDIGKTARYGLVYSFSLTGDSDCCSAMSVQPTIKQETQEPTANVQQGQGTRILIEAPRLCFCDPGPDIKRVRSIRCLYLWKCADKF